MASTVYGSRFEAIAEHQKAQRQPHVDDIKLCGGCDGDFRGHGATARGERNLSGATASVSFLTQTVETDGATYEVIDDISGEWMESYRGRLDGGGVFDIHRPTLESDGSEARWQSPGEGLGDQLAKDMHDVALEAAINCGGLNEAGSCPIALAIADRMVKSVLDHPHFAPHLEAVPE